jgi:hypothetical protein
LEKKGESIVRDPFREKSEDMINEWDLLDIKLVKGKYTWTNKRSGLGHIVSKLDRFLIHNSLLLWDFTFKPRILLSILFDHKLISLHFQISPYYDPLPFRFTPL